MEISIYAKYIEKFNALVIKTSAEFFLRNSRILFLNVHRKIKIQRELRYKQIVKISRISLIIKTSIL